MEVGRAAPGITQRYPIAHLPVLGLGDGFMVAFNYQEVNT